MIHQPGLHFHDPMVLLRPSLLLFACASFAAAAQDPLHRRFTMQDGIPSNTVYRCMEDHDGFLWVSSDAGVVRFDGTHMDIFGLEQGLSDEDIFKTSIDSKGRIWFFTANGRPCYLDGGVVHSWRSDTVLARVQLRSGIGAFLEDASGAIWLGGLRGELAVIHPDGTVGEYDIQDPEAGQPRSHVGLYPKEDGTVQIFNEHRLVGLDGRAISPSATDQVRSKTFVSRQEPFLIVRSDSAIQWRGDHWAVLITREELPGSPAIAHVLPLGDDELWVSLHSGGVLWLRREGDGWVPVRDLMFEEDLIMHVVRDAEGSIWISTAYGGLIVVSARGIGTTFYTGTRGGNEEFLRAHAGERLGVWVGTNQGDVYHLGRQLELVDLPPSGPLFSKVRSIGSRGDELWIATDRRTFRMDRSDAAPFAEQLRAITPLAEREELSWGIKSLAMASNGRVIGSVYGLMEFDHQARIFRHIVDPNIPTMRIYAPHFDAAGSLWFEENGLLCSWSDEGVRTYPQLGLQQGYRITDITSHADTLFLATNGKGLLVVVGGQLLRTITEADGLSSDHIHRLFADKDLFLATDRGADHLTGPWAAPRLQLDLTGLSGATRHVRDVVADSAWVYVLYAEGLVRIPRGRGQGPIGMAKPYFRSVRVNGEHITGNAMVGIRGGRDRLVVELGAIHFSAPGSVRLQYRLLPEGTWQQAYGGLVDLSATASGNHVLQVRAALGQGAWSVPVELIVVVVPPLRERWWAKALLVFLAVGFVFLVLRFLAYRRYRVRMAALREREAMAAARQRMAMDLHDDLGAELSSILLLTRMEREGQAPGSLERVEQLIGTLAEKVKEVIWSTDPGSDTLEATLVFIQRYTIKLCERHGLRVRTTIPTVLPHVDLDAGRRRELYLIAKEAVNNTVKHAGATALTLIVTVDADAVELDLADDGKGGATLEHERMGSGLRNMNTRATAIGASLEINEVRPHGTRITLRLPLAPGDPNG